MHACPSVPVRVYVYVETNAPLRPEADTPRFVRGLHTCERPAKILGRDERKSTRESYALVCCHCSHGARLSARLLLSLLFTFELEFSAHPRRPMTMCQFSTEWWTRQREQTRRRSSKTIRRSPLASACIASVPLLQIREELQRT